VLADTFLQLAELFLKLAEMSLNAMNCILRNVSMFTKLILILAGIVSKDLVTVPAADEAVLDFTVPYLVGVLPVCANLCSNADLWKGSNLPAAFKK
jgi:hypothetical protein